MTNFDGSTVTGVEGTFKTTVRFGDRQAEIEIYVLSDRCSAVIGRDTIQSLALVLDGSDCSVKVVTYSGGSGKLNTDQNATISSNSPISRLFNCFNINIVSKYVHRKLCTNSFIIHRVISDRKMYSFFWPTLYMVQNVVCAKIRGRLSHISGTI